MRYLAFLIRISIIIIGILMIYRNPNFLTPPFCSGVAFILIGVYLTIGSIFGHKSTRCLFMFFGDKSSCKK